MRTFGNSISGISCSFLEKARAAYPRVHDFPALISAASFPRRDRANNGPRYRRSRNRLKTTLAGQGRVSTRGAEMWTSSAVSERR